MKHGLIIFCLLPLFFSPACSNRTELAASAVANDFEGQWIGKWNWDSNQSSSVEISKGHLKASRLPMESSKSYSAEGEAKFEPEYGSKGAPCVLLYFSDNKEVIPLFISKDKKHLIYTFDINFDQQIIFEKSPQQDHTRTNQAKH